MRAVTRRRVRLLLFTLALSVMVGVVIGGATGPMHGPPLLALALGALSGATIGAILAVVIGGAEIFLPHTRLGQALDRAPFVVAFGAKWMFYSGAIVLVLGSMVGRRVASLVLGLEHAHAPDPHMTTTSATLGVALALLVSFAFSLLFDLGDLVGQRTLRDIVLGRYHRPRAEERFFLFIDVAGSTPLAERVGPPAVHRFLGEVFRLAADPIEEHGGEVYQYVGDEMVITWTVAAGREGARAAACFFAVDCAVGRAASTFEREFGAVPRLRAALHAGPVIAGEVGGSRRAIVYHGDVMNTASRIEQATRDLDRQFLASSDAIEKLPRLDDMVLEDLGLQHLRGRVAPMHVYAVSVKPLPTAPTTV